MSNKFKYKILTFLSNALNIKMLHSRKLAAGIVILATACTGGGNYSAIKVAELTGQLKVISPPKQDSIVIVDSIIYSSPIDSIFIYPIDCYAEAAPVMCYDQPAEPTCYGQSAPINE